MEDYKFERFEIEFYGRIINCFIFDRNRFGDGWMEMKIELDGETFSSVCWVKQEDMEHEIARCKKRLEETIRDAASDRIILEYEEEKKALESWIKESKRRKTIAEGILNIIDKELNK